MIPKGTHMISVKRVISFHCAQLIYIFSQSFFIAKYGVIKAHLYVLPPSMIPNVTCMNSLKKGIWFHYVKSISIFCKHFFMAKSDVLIAHGFSMLNQFPFFARFFTDEADVLIAHGFIKLNQFQIFSSIFSWTKPECLSPMYMNHYLLLIISVHIDT